MGCLDQNKEKIRFKSRSYMSLFHKITIFQKFSLFTEKS